MRLGAEYALHRGQQCRGEALLRRILNIVGVGDPLGAKTLLDKLTAAPAFPNDLSIDRMPVAIDTDCSLWRFHESTVSYAASESLSYRWYMLAPSTATGRPLNMRRSAAPFPRRSDYRPVPTTPVDTTRIASPLTQTARLGRPPRLCWVAHRFCRRSQLAVTLERRPTLL